MKLNIAILVILAGLVLGGCKTKYVSVPEVHTEYITRVDTTVRKDIVYLKDSVYVERKGDTMFINKTVYRDRFQHIYKVKTDTILKRDSVNIAYPVEKGVKRSERIFIALGKVFSVLLLVLFIAVLIKRYLIW